MADDNKVEISIGAKIDAATSAITDLSGKFAGFSESVKGHMNAVTAASVNLTGGIEQVVKATQKAVTTDAEWNEIAEKSKVMRAEAAAKMAEKTAAINQLKERTAEVVARVQQQMAAEQQLETQKAMQKHLKDVNGHMTQTISHFKHLLGLFGVGFGLHFFKGMVTHVIESESKLRNMSIQTGISVESLSKLDQVGERTGLSMQRLAMMLTMMTRVMAQVSTEQNPRAIAAFDALGISISDVKTALDKGNLDEFLKTIATRLFEIENPAKRASVQMSLGFARGGAAAGAMIPFLKELVETQDLHADRTTEGAEAAFQFRAKMIDLTRSIETMKISFVGLLIPVMSDFITAFVSVTGKMDTAHQKSSEWVVILRVMALGVAVLGYTYTQLQNNVAGAYAVMAGFFNRSKGEIKEAIKLHNEASLQIEKDWMRVKGLIMGEAGVPGSSGDPAPKPKDKKGTRTGDLENPAALAEKLAVWKDELRRSTKPRENSIKLLQRQTLSTGAASLPL